MRVPLVNLKAGLDETETVWRANLERLFERAQFILGPELQNFEREFAAAMQARYAVGVGTGTAAIELCLRAAGITEREQEVITSPLTAPFTGIAILAAGASIRFADVDAETLLLDAGKVRGACTQNTAAIVPVHLYGQACELEHLALPGTVMIQDACQAHGACRQGRPFSDFSQYVTYSFYPTKNLGGVGDGGAIVTNDGAVAERLAMLRDGGRQGGHVSATAGINSRLDEIQCCFLRAFLPRLDEWNRRRAQIAAIYDDGFADFAPARPVVRRDRSVHHLYVIRAERRDALRQHLEQHGAGTGVHYPTPLHLQPAFAACGAQAGDFPVAEQACREIVSLPMWPHMRDGDAAFVVDLVRDFYRG